MDNIFLMKRLSFFLSIFLFHSQTVPPILLLHHLILQTKHRIIHLVRSQDLPKNENFLLPDSHTKQRRNQDCAICPFLFDIPPVGVEKF